MNRNYTECFATCVNTSSLAGLFGEVTNTTVINTDNPNCQGMGPFIEECYITPWYLGGWGPYCQEICQLYGTWADVPESERQPNLIFGLTQEQLLLVAGAFIAIKALK